jgi:hypothetical protein
MDEMNEQESTDSATIPASLLGGKTVKPGDEIRLEVVGIDPETETVEVRYAQAEQPIEGDTTINDMAARFKPSQGEA